MPFLIGLTGLFYLKALDTSCLGLYRDRVSSSAVVTLPGTCQFGVLSMFMYVCLWQ